MVSVFDLLVLSQIKRVGSIRLRSLVGHFGGLAEISEASPRQIIKVDGFDKNLASEVSNIFRDSRLDKLKKYAEEQLSLVTKHDCEIISFWDSRYPKQLKQIYDPPIMLFVQGEIVQEDEFSLAIVGTRIPTKYGVMMTEMFSKEFSKVGITIVSGLASGIDTVAHDSALKIGGRTIAVIGSGIDFIYPVQNVKLAEKIVSQGAIVSEYPMGTEPAPGNFPRRNRIISGLSLGTLIIETDIDGGAMITANTALDQNREVFAIPGNVTSKKSRGCNLLVKEGRAKLVETVDDILQELEQKLQPILRKGHKNKHKGNPELSLFEKKVYDLLSENPLHIDLLSEQANISTSDALVNLLSLEFKGLVKQLPGKMFMKL